MRCRRVVANAPCSRANQECSITFTWPTRSPSSCSRAPLTASGTAASRPVGTCASGERVHPPHVRTEAQPARLPGGDVFRQERDFGVHEKVLHELDDRFIRRL